MAKSSSKRNAKSTKTGSAQPSKPSPSGPPVPYAAPPPVLAPFLENLDVSHIYIVHVDNHPWAFKRRVFTVPIIMNVVIVVLLLWRAYMAIPSYVLIALATFGYSNQEKVDVESTGWPILIWIAVRRAAMFLTDWALARFIVPWPLDFFLASPANPVSWRNKVGFKDKEIVVRQSRKWDRDLPSNWLAEGIHGKVYREHIMYAIDQDWVQRKTGYLMMDKNWDLDFEAMISAHELVAQNRASASDFQKMVIVYTEDFGWLVWSAFAGDEGSQEDARKKLVAFKERLTMMGKESLFFRYIELLQYETSMPGDFTSERQVETTKKVADLFESQDVNFDQVWTDIGGMDGLPGVKPD